MLQRRKSRPMAGRKNKEAREKAVQDHRAVRGDWYLTSNLLPTGIDNTYLQYATGHHGAIFQLILVSSI